MLLCHCCVIATAAAFRLVLAEVVPAVLLTVTYSVSHSVFSASAFSNNGVAVGC